MSEIGILIIAFVIVSAIGITVKRLKVNHKTYENIRYVHGYHMESFKRYAIKHNYDLRANKLVMENASKIRRLSRGSEEYANAMGDLLHDILSPYKHLMDNKELRAYKDRNWREMELMVSECLNPSPRFNGIPY